MRIGMGCVGLGTATGGRTFGADVRLVRTALDSGVTVLDTAAAYGSGMSERIIGAALAHRRDDVVVATKGGYVVRPRSRAEFAARREVVRARRVVDRLRHHDQPGAAPSGHGNYASQDFSAAALRRALEASLRRLRTDHVDVYQLHGPPSVLPDVMPTLLQFVTEGKVRQLGVGAESLASAEAWSRVDGIDTLQLPVGVLDAASRAVATDISRSGREVWARGVFGGGVLAAAEAGDAAVRADPSWPLADRLTTLARRHGTTPFALAYGFVRAIPGVTTVVIGMSRPQHVARNMAIVHGPALSDDLLRQLDELLGVQCDGSTA